MKKLAKVAAAAGIVAALGGASSSWAVTASADVEATAGLLPLISLECTPINFGVWRVPVRSTGGVTTVTLTATSGATGTLGGNTTSVAASSKSGHAAAPGMCTLSGSAAPDATAVALTVQTATTSLAGNGTAYVGMAAPVAVAPIVLPASITVPASGVSVTAGVSIFYVGGELTIPAAITSDDYGGYKSATAFAITADDGI